MGKNKNTFWAAFGRFIGNLLLGTVYLLGIGLTVLLSVIFDRRLLMDRKVSDTSAWQEASGYDLDKDNMMRQS